MRKIMVIQHVGHEPLGTLNPMLKAAGFRIRYVNFGRHPDSMPSIEGYYGLIVLGGPMGVYEVEKFPHLRIEMGLIEQALKKNIPVLGICLGSQLIAHVLGSRVYKAPRWEIGWSEVSLTEAGQSDPLFARYQSSESIFQLHQDTFETPPSAVHLARTRACEAQAFRYGEKVYGLQFHLEADQHMITRWLNHSHHQHLFFESSSGAKPEEIQADTRRFIHRSLELSRETFGKFIEIFKLPDRPVFLGSTHAKPLGRDD